MFKGLEGRGGLYGEDLKRFSKLMMVMGVCRKMCRCTVTVEMTDGVSKSNRCAGSDVICCGSGEGFDTSH